MPSPVLVQSQTDIVSSVHSVFCPINFSLLCFSKGKKLILLYRQLFCNFLFSCHWFVIFPQYIPCLEKQWIKSSKYNFTLWQCKRHYGYSVDRRYYEIILNNLSFFFLFLYFLFEVSDKILTSSRKVLFVFLLSVFSFAGAFLLSVSPLWCCYGSSQTDLEKHAHISCPCFFWAFY